MKIDGRSSICHKVVYEVRYKYGFTYLDRCGSTINEIMKTAPEWILAEATPNPQNAPLLSLRNGTRFNFSALKYDFALEQTLGAEKDLERSDLDEFIEQVGFVSAIVNDRLGLKDFNRVGFRIWYLFGCSSKEESERWILELFPDSSVDATVAKAFGGPIEARNYVILVSSQDRKFRISVNGVERNAQVDLGDSILGIRASQLSSGQDKFLIQQLQAKKRIRMNPEFAAMIDVDAFVERPKDVEARDFVSESLKQIEERLPNAFKKGG